MFAGFFPRLVLVYLLVDNAFCVAFTNADLPAAVSGWCAEAVPPNYSTSAFEEASGYGAIRSWDVSAVTSMTQLFNGETLCNPPGLSAWNTSQVSSMDYMFYDAHLFNQPLSFDTSRVTRMNSMFSGASAFNNPISFDTRSVTSMDYMFSGARSFDQPLSFDTSRVTSMKGLLSFASSFDQNLVAWNTDRVTSCTSFSEFCEGCGLPVFPSCEPCIDPPVFCGGIRKCACAETPQPRLRPAPGPPPSESRSESNPAQWIIGVIIGLILLSVLLGPCWRRLKRGLFTQREAAGEARRLGGVAPLDLSGQFTPAAAGSDGFNFDSVENTQQPDPANQPFTSRDLPVTPGYSWEVAPKLEEQEDEAAEEENEEDDDDWV